MGRAKVSMKLIECPKSRHATFIKRRKGLKKKTFEFATLCGVDVCLICFGPLGDRLSEPEIWPNDPSEVKRIIKRYQSLSIDEQCRRKLDLSGFLEERRKKLEDELKHMSIEEATSEMCPSWDNRLNECSWEMLQNLLATLDSKLAAVNEKLESMKKFELMKENDSFKGKELSVEIAPQKYPNQGMLGMCETHYNNDTMASFQPPQFSYLKPLAMELPCISNIPNYSFSNFNTNNNNMLAPPIMGYYADPRIGAMDRNMFHSQNELCNAECVQCLMQYQASVIGTPSSSTSNSGSAHGLFVNQTHHMNHGFDEFQMIQTKRERY